jgi:hypothetical protein
LVASGVPDTDPAAGWFTSAVFVICACVEAVLLPDWAAVLPESCVQPVIRMPAMRIADAISIMILLFFMDVISLMYHPVDRSWSLPENRLIHIQAGSSPNPDRD